MYNIYINKACQKKTDGTRQINYDRVKGDGGSVEMKIVIDNGFK